MIYQPNFIVPTNNIPIVIINNNELILCIKVNFTCTNSSLLIISTVSIFSPYKRDFVGSCLILCAYLHTYIIEIDIKTIKHTILYSIPENNFTPATCCAIPMVKGFIVAEANPTATPKYIILLPTIAS